jgi:ABC-2 type transport system permease protein
MKIRYLSKQNRALLSELIRTDFKLRYQGSILGYAWSLLRPLLMFGILYLVFGVVLNTGGSIPHFPIYLLLGIVMWQFFSDMTTQSLGSIVMRGDLIRKISIPRWMVVASTSAAALISLGLNLIVVSIFMIFNGIDLMKTILFFPFILLEVYVLALGLSLFLSAAFVKYRDISYIWEVLLQAGFYLTPILYAMTFIQNVTVQKILLLNPMAQAIQDARFSVVTHDPQVITVWRIFEGGWYAFIPLIIVVIILVFGIWYFKKEAKFFAENL